MYRRIRNDFWNILIKLTFNHCGVLCQQYPRNWKRHSTKCTETILPDTPSIPFRIHAKTMLKYIIIQVNFYIFWDALYSKNNIMRRNTHVIRDVFCILVRIPTETSLIDFSKYSDIFFQQNYWKYHMLRRSTHVIPNAFRILLQILTYKYSASYCRYHRVFLLRDTTE